MEARIFVIQNDEGIRDLLTLCMNKQGWQVFGFPYAGGDLVTLKQQRPDLILLDFNLQDEGVGWGFLQLLKMDETTATIPILITTTSADLSAEVQDYLLSRHIGVVRMPFDVDAFVTMVQKTLTQARQAGVLFSCEDALPILVVDDTETLRDNVTTLLNLEGYAVITASNGREALESVARADYCLILLDLAMPIMNGLEFLSAYDRQLRPHSPIIILSAEPDIQSRVFPAFVVDALPKPFDFHVLLSIVGKYAQPV